MVDLGSAKWGDDSETGYKMETFSRGDWLFFGQNYKNKNRFYGLQPERHLLTISPTRGGKGVSLIIPNLLMYKGSVVVIDPKGENAWITAKARREKFGQKTYILDPWGEVNRRYGEKAGELENVAGFNPLSILDPNSEHYVDDLAYVADSLIINQGKDPHWDNSARELVAGLISFLVESFGSSATLAQMRVLLSKPADEMAAIAAKAQELGFDSVAARKLGRFVIDSKENAGIISTALTQTAFLDSLALSQSMAASDFSFDDLVNGYNSIYLVLPVDKLQTYGRWLRLMISIAIRTVARNTRTLAAPVLFMLDEFGTIGRLSAVAQAFGLMAGLQMCVWAFLQDFNQLKRDYPDDWETFVGNSAAVTAFSLMDQFSCEYISKMLGTQTIVQESIKSAEQKAAGGAGLVTDQHFARPLYHPEEIRAIMDIYGFIIGRHNPHRYGIIKYFQVPNLLLSSRANPNFPDDELRQEAREIVQNWEDQNEEEKIILQIPQAEFMAWKNRIPNWETAEKYLVNVLGYEIEKETEGGFFKKYKFVCKKNGKKIKEFDDKNAFYGWALNRIMVASKGV